MTPAVRPVRPTGHKATCDCDPCATYWCGAFRFELQVRRKEHQAIENELLAGQAWAPPGHHGPVGTGRRGQLRLTMSVHDEIRTIQARLDALAGEHDCPYTRGEADECPDPKAHASVALSASAAAQLLSRLEAAESCLEQIADAIELPPASRKVWMWEDYLRQIRIDHEARMASLEGRAEDGK